MTSKETNSPRYISSHGTDKRNGCNTSDERRNRTVGIETLDKQNPWSEANRRGRKGVSAKFYQRNSEQTEQKAGVLNVFGTNSWPKCL